MSMDNIASLATAVGVGLVFWQICAGRKIAQTTFEDGLDKEYRHLAMDIPVDALLGKPINDNKGKVREVIYNYLDLCNEQIYLRQNKRIGNRRWKDWNDGIKDSLSKPAFKEVTHPPKVDPVFV